MAWISRDSTVEETAFVRPAGRWLPAVSAPLDLESNGFRLSYIEEDSDNDV